MFYEEKYINERLMYRMSPKGKWHECSIERVQEKIEELMIERDDLLDQLQSCN